MNAHNYRKQFIVFLMCLCFGWLGMDTTRVEGKEANGPWEAQEKPGAEAQEFKNNVMELKNRRDTEIAALIKQRDGKIQELLNTLKQTTQADITQINKDQQYIQQNKLKGKTLAKAQTALRQEELALNQKSLVIKQEIKAVGEIYDQQIQRLIQAFAKQFELLQQQMSTEH